MLLAPQHFQQSAFRNELLLHWRAVIAAPYQWGVLRMTHDATLLLNGRFRVRSLEALMPDGMPIWFSAEEGDDLEVDLEAYADELRAGSVTIHLGVIASRSAAAGAGGDMARFDSLESEPIPDENTGEEGVRLPVLRPRLTLLVGDAPPSRYVSMPIARIGLKNGLHALTDYIPPVLHVTAESPLGEICTEVARTLREKAMHLAEEIRTRRYDMGPAHVSEQQSKIQSMVEPLPYLEGLLNAGTAHPFRLYLALCLAAGHAAPLGETRVPPVPPKYDHNDLRPSFMPLRDFILDAVEQGVWEEFLAITFNLRNDLFTRRIEAAWMTGPPLLVGVRGAPRVNQRDIAAWMDASLIGSAPLVSSLRERRILGATRRAYAGEEPAIASRGLMLFEIDTDREFVQPDQELVIANVEDGSASVEEIVLFMRNKRSV